MKVGSVCSQESQEILMYNLRRGWTICLVSGDISSEILREHPYSRLLDGWKETQGHQASRSFPLANVNLGTSLSLFVYLLTRSGTHSNCQALFGTSLTMADGILTAAVSVTSAVGGIGKSLIESTSRGS
jgi:K+ potassium transporter